MLLVKPNLTLYRLFNENLLTVVNVYTYQLVSVCLLLPFDVQLVNIG